MLLHYLHRRLWELLEAPSVVCRPSASGAYLLFTISTFNCCEMWDNAESWWQRVMICSVLISGKGSYSSARQVSKSPCPLVRWVSLAALLRRQQPVIIWLLVICPTGGQISTQECWADMWLTFGTVPALVLKAILESKVAANGRTVSVKVQPQQDCGQIIN